MRHSGFAIFICMGIVDFILNLAALLLWLNWRSMNFDPLFKRTPATLMGTLRPAAPKKLQRWHFLVFIAALIFFRAIIYWWIGSAVNWTARLDLNAVIVSFHCSPGWFGFQTMLVFSFFSLMVALGTFYLCLLPLSLLQGPEQIHRLVKIPLGRVDDWPRWAKIILPFFGTAVFWWLATWLFGGLHISAKPIGAAERFEESIILGACSYLIWKFPLGVILLLHLLNSYIYFGKHPFWKYVNVTAQKILSPLEKIPLHIGKVDFAPVAMVAAIFFAAEGAGYWLWKLYTKLPL
jgi:uncharacterized protein YggT (Ycf19 family)